MAEDVKKMPVGAGLPEMPEEIVIATKASESILLKT